MTPERWQQIDNLFHQAVPLDVAARTAFLDRSCSGDEALRRELEALLAADACVSTTIRLPAQVAAEWAKFRQAKTDTGFRLGVTLGHFQIKALLGRGGMGEVYLAEDLRLGRPAALKVLLPEFTGDAERVHRFKQEARAASALNHPNIVTIFEIDEVGGDYFIATEFIEGETLRRRLARAALTIEESLEIVRQIATALREAHAAGIVHRDIKPENVMLRPDGLVKVLDFGLAKLGLRKSGAQIPATLDEASSETGIVMGTAAYMSPEQARGQQVDERADIFSLGVLLYELVAGRRPFTGATAGDVIAAILTREPVQIGPLLPHASPELNAVLSKALRKDCLKRYQTMDELLSDLKRISDSSPASPNEFGRWKLSRHPRMLPVWASLLVLVGTLFFFKFQSKQQERLTNRDWVLLADFNNSTGDTVFDGTLKQGLAVALSQSPFLNIFPEAKARQTLRLMGRSADEKITPETGREICQRQGLKALMTGSIAPLGAHYAITLEAINARTGEAIARELAEAENKEKVLGVLGREAASLREKLGESLPSIQKFDAPLELTTSSLEALRAFSLGRERSYKGRYLQAISFHQRAVELDPNFAFAHAVLAAMYSYTGQPNLAATEAKKAHELKHRAGELENFLIDYFYRKLVTGELNKAIETLELWRQTYPRDWRPQTNMAECRLLLGQFEPALDAAKESVSRDSNAVIGHERLGEALIRLGRFAQAQAVLEQALLQKTENEIARRDLFQLAFIASDSAALKQHSAWALGQPEEYTVWHWQSQAAVFGGQMRAAREFFQRARELAVRTNAQEIAENIAANEALLGVIGSFAGTNLERFPAASLFESNEVSMWQWALAFALKGDLKQAQALAEKLAARHPQATVIHSIRLPVIRAAIELGRNRPAQTIRELNSSRQYQAAAEFWVNFLIGQAYLRQKDGKAAAAEFQMILEHRGWAPMSVLFPLAHLELARARTLEGNSHEAHQAYQQFFELWKDADSDLPILQRAKKEFASLSRKSGTAS